MGNKAKRVLCAALAAALAAGTSLPAYAASYGTGDKVDQRIQSVGRSYLGFYKEVADWGWDSDYYSGMSIASGATDGAAGSDEFFNGGEAYESSNAESMKGPDSFWVPEMEEPAPVSNNEFSHIKENGRVSVAANPFSTFGADVDTASYSTMRRQLLEPLIWDMDPGQNLEPSAIRIEEMVNYFDYHYGEDAWTDGEDYGYSKYGMDTQRTGEEESSAPVDIYVDTGECPWVDPDSDVFLMRVAVKAKDEVPRTGSNIVFLIDTSGSMYGADRLELVKNAMIDLCDRLGQDDTVSIVRYAGSEGVVLEGACGADKQLITRALEKLDASGSTNGAGGIRKAYEIAEEYYIEGGNNRVILCTDGDFNVGVSSEAGLTALIEEKRKSGVFLSCIGVGDGNYSDTTMEALADNGNGNYFYLDCEKEAERALDDCFFSTMYTVAKDVKFQVEFNPALVKGYRQIGYENRAMAAEDFANDEKDGGEVGAGQTVTVLYEVVPVGSDVEVGDVESHYAHESDRLQGADLRQSLATVSVRYKEPDSDESKLLEKEVPNEVTVPDDFDLVWAAGVAQAGMLLRGSEYAEYGTFEDIYDRLKEDPEVMTDDSKALFLFMLPYMEEYVEERASWDDGYDYYDYEYEDDDEHYYEYSDDFDFQE